MSAAVPIVVRYLRRCRRSYTPTAVIFNGHIDSDGIQRLCQHEIGAFLQPMPSTDRPPAAALSSATSTAAVYGPSTAGISTATIASSTFNVHMYSNALNWHTNLKRDGVHGPSARNGSQQKAHSDTQGMHRHHLPRYQWSMRLAQKIEQGDAGGGVYSISCLAVVMWP